MTPQNDGPLFKEDAVSDSPRRSRIQFSLRSILWLMLCIAVAFAANRRGFDKGFARGFADGANSREHVGITFAKVYYVEDFLWPELENGKPVSLYSEALIRDLTANVLPNTWQKNGGDAAIRSFDSNGTLLILHDQDGHDRVAEYLKRRREKMSQLAAGN